MSKIAAAGKFITTIEIIIVTKAIILQVKRNGVSKFIFSGFKNIIANVKKVVMYIVTNDLSYKICGRKSMSITETKNDT